MSSNFNPQFSKLGEILIQNGKATESGVNDALAEQKVTNEKIGVTLIEMGYIEEDDFTSAYAEQLDTEKLIILFCLKQIQKLPVNSQRILQRE